MGTIDQQAKKILQDYVRDILALILPRLTNLEPMHGEIAATQRIMDRTFTAIFMGIAVFVHFEIQLGSDASMPQRLYEYATRLSTSIPGEIRPVFSIVIWLEDNGPVPASPFILSAGGDIRATWKFDTLKAYELTLDQLRDAGVGLLLLAPLAQALTLADLPPIVAQLRMKANPTELSEIGALFKTFAQRCFRRRQEKERIQQMLREGGFMMDVIDQLIGETDVAVALAEKARLEGEAKALLVLWEGRFGAPSEAVRAAVAAATSEQIQEVLRHWATDGTPEHVLARLGQS